MFWPVKFRTYLNTLEVPLEQRDISNWDSNLDFADGIFCYNLFAIRTDKLGEIMDFRKKIRFTTIGRNINST